MPSAGLVIGAGRALRRVGRARLLARGAAVGRRSGAPRLSQATIALHARVPLADVGDAGGAVGVPGEPDRGSGSSSCQNGL